MERPHMSVAKPPNNNTALSPSLISASNLGIPTIAPLSPSPSGTQQLRQITNGNDKPTPHFRFNEPYTPGVSPYMHPMSQDNYAITSAPTTSAASPLTPALLQRDQNNNSNVLRSNFSQREAIPANNLIPESMHHSTPPPESGLKEPAPIITNHGASSDNNNNDVVSIASASSSSQHAESSTTNNDGDTSSALSVLPAKSGQTYVDITEYLNMPQSDAAKKLLVPTSTLSKRWKEAVRGRKWPYRMVCKLDKEIMTLLHNIPQGPGAPPLPEEVEATLGLLIRKRSEELKPVVIRI